MIAGRLARVRSIYDEFPRPFWTLIGATFIDNIGEALLFPFYTLYVTAKFGIGMTEVGLFFAIYSLASVAGTTLGGALADRLGRKRLVIYGLVASALCSLGMGLAPDLWTFVAAALIAGLFAQAGMPARQAMIADLLPAEKRSQGYGVFRVVMNLAITIGPAIGGLLAARSFLLLFVGDALASIVMALIVRGRIPETIPQARPDEERPSTLDTLRGYRSILRDSRYLLFLLASSLVVLVYMQMNGTLAVYLRDVHQVNTQAFGMLISLNAAMVVVFQFAISRRLGPYPPFQVMAIGTALYALGFSMYGLLAGYGMFMLAMVVITIGEMLVAPTGQALAANMAREDMRGRYLAAYGLTWMVPTATGFILAGLIMDNLDPRWVWYSCGLLGSLAAVIFLRLHGSAARTDQLPEPSTLAVRADGG